VSLAGVALGLTAQGALAYNATANVVNAYNSDFATDAQCAPGGGLVPPSFTDTNTRKYGCRVGFEGVTDVFIKTPSPGVDAGPVGQAAGTLTVTDTSLKGTLTILSTTDEPTGATIRVVNGVRVSNSVGNGTDGYNYRTADGSPFGNVWYGVTTAGTFTVDLTGTFTATSWSITGGTATFSDPGFACQQGGLGGEGQQGLLCTESTTSGGFSANGGHLSWGMDPDGAGTGSLFASGITIRDLGGTSVLSVLSGVLASLTIDAAGNVTTGFGEFRRGAASASNGCADHLRYDTASGSLICGTLTAGRLNVSGTVAAVPVPGVAWLLGAALGAVGLRARRRTA